MNPKSTELIRLIRSVSKMALFGAPVSYEDNCRRAVAAAYEMPEDKAALLMKERCIDFIQNPPENWDGAITYHTK